MKRIKFLSPLLLLAVSVMASLSLVAVSPALVYADGVTDGLNQINNSFPTTVLSGQKTPAQIFAMIINVALGIAFAVAVIMVIYGGYQYITSAGNEEKATSGRQTVLYALIGMVIIVLSFVIVSAVVNFIQKGVNGTSGTTTTTSTTPTTSTPPIINPNPPGPTTSPTTGKPCPPAPQICI